MGCRCFPLQQGKRYLPDRPDRFGQLGMTRVRACGSNRLSFSSYHPKPSDEVVFVDRVVDVPATQQRQGRTHRPMEFADEAYKRRRVEAAEDLQRAENALTAAITSVQALEESIEYAKRRLKEHQAEEEAARSRYNSAVAAHIRHAAREAELPAMRWIRRHIRGLPSLDTATVGNVVLGLREAGHLLPEPTRVAALVNLAVNWREDGDELLTEDEEELYANIDRIARNLRDEPPEEDPHPVAVSLQETQPSSSSGVFRRLR